MNKAKGAHKFKEIDLQAASGTHSHCRRLGTSVDEAEVAMDQADYGNGYCDECDVDQSGGPCG